MNLDNEEWLIVDGVLKEYRGNEVDVKIPYGVTRINKTVFLRKGLRSVSIPSSVEKIGDNAFFSNWLRQIEFLEGLKYIGTSAFEGNFVDEVTFPSTLSTLRYDSLGQKIKVLNFTTKERLSYFRIR